MSFSPVSSGKITTSELKIPHFWTMNLPEYPSSAGRSATITDPWIYSGAKNWASAWKVPRVLDLSLKAILLLQIWFLDTFSSESGFFLIGFTFNNSVLACINKSASWKLPSWRDRVSSGGAISLFSSGRRILFSCCCGRILWSSGCGRILFSSGCWRFLASSGCGRILWSSGCWRILLPAVSMLILNSPPSVSSPSMK